MIAVTPWRRTLSTWVHPESDLYTLNPQYLDGIHRAGGHGVIVPAVASIGEARALLDRFDGLLLSGGQDVDPAMYGAQNTASVGVDHGTDASDVALTLAAIELDRPVLAICRGLQVLNVALGGTLHQDIWGCSPHHRARPTTDDPAADADAYLADRHLVELTPGSTIAKLFDGLEVKTNSLHHQSIDSVAEGLTVTGRAPDGIIESVEHVSGRVVGVQWHPERLPPTSPHDDGHDRLFGWLVSETRS